MEPFWLGVHLWGSSLIFTISRTTDSLMPKILSIFSTKNGMSLTSSRKLNKKSRKSKDIMTLTHKTTLKIKIKFLGTTEATITVTPCFPADRRTFKDPKENTISWPHFLWFFYNSFLASMPSYLMHFGSATMQLLKSFTSLSSFF